MRIFAFSGKRGSGKTTICNHLRDCHGARDLSFAAPLRQELAAIGYPEYILNEKPTPDEIRALLIAHGQARRFIDPEYWIKKLFASIDMLPCLGRDPVVIDDLRFWNEAEKLKNHKATLVRLERYGLQNATPGVDDDDSETELDDWHEWDYVVQAPDGGLSDLYSFANALVNGALR